MRAAPLSWLSQFLSNTLLSHPQVRIAVPLRFSSSWEHSSCAGPAYSLHFCPNHAAVKYRTKIFHPNVHWKVNGWQAPHLLLHMVTYHWFQAVEHLP
jgi:hypothetical protein